jgi:hypothetical protein
MNIFPPGKKVRKRIMYVNSLLLSGHSSRKRAAVEEVSPQNGH